VVDALFRAIPGMASIIAVLALIFYVGAVLATMLFGQFDPPLDPDDNMQAWFGSIGASMYTLFQIMTLESWSMGIVRPTMELYPWSWAFFVPFIVLTSFAVLNLFIGIIVDSMQRQHEAEAEASRAQIRASAHEERAALAEELRGLRTEIAELRAAVEQKPPA
jgi:voltage-gated sodium channel